MNFEEKLDMYAQLIACHGMNVQKGQEVEIRTEPYHRDLALKVAKAAYQRGAKIVNIQLNDPQLTYLRLTESIHKEDTTYVPPYFPDKYNHLVKTGGCVATIIGLEEPDLLSHLDPKLVNNHSLSVRKTLKHFYEEGISKSKVQWTIAAAPTPKWALKIFPDLSEEAAMEKLWDEIFKICRADTPECLTLWKEHNTQLHARARKLNDLKIKTLHFKGPGTDLTVGLSEKARFQGGTDTGPSGEQYEPNLPTEECFTTPDWRLTNGKVKATRPFMINGKLIEGLTVEFKEGKIAHFDAQQGAQTFGEYTQSDEGACRLGEVALVGIDSPIFQSGLVFQEILFDENAACHIAVGSAYTFCIRGGDKMSRKELDAIGCNESNVHTDMMISDENVDVIGLTYDGKEISIIEKGHWSEAFQATHSAV